MSTFFEGVSFFNPSLMTLAKTAAVGPQDLQAQAPPPGGDPTQMGGAAPPPGVDPNVGTDPSAGMAPPVPQAGQPPVDPAAASPAAAPAPKDPNSEKLDVGTFKREMYRLEALVMSMMNQSGYQIPPEAVLGEPPTTVQPASSEPTLNPGAAAAPQAGGQPAQDPNAAAGAPPQGIQPMTPGAPPQ